MSASLTTENFKLPIYVNSDTIAYIPSWNDAMQTIDGQMEKNAQAAGTATSSIEVLTQQVSGLNTSINALSERIGELSVSVNTKILSGSLGNGIAGGFRVAVTNNLLSAVFSGNYSHEEVTLITLNNYKNIVLFTLPNNPLNFAEKQTANVGRAIRHSSDGSGGIGNANIYYENNITYFLLPGANAPSLDGYAFVEWKTLVVSS